MLNQIWVNSNKISFFQEFIHCTDIVKTQLVSQYWNFKQKSQDSKYLNLFHQIQKKRGSICTGKIQNKTYPALLILEAFRLLGAWDLGLIGLQTASISGCLDDKLSMKPWWSSMRVWITARSSGNGSASNSTRVFSLPISHCMSSSRSARRSLSCLRWS